MTENTWTICKTINIEIQTWLWNIRTKKQKETVNLKEKKRWWKNRKENMTDKNEN